MKILKSDKFTNLTSDSLRIYFNELRKLRLLSPEEEAEFASRAAKGDKKAANELICGNLRLVVTIAKTYAYPHLEDLIQAGDEGMIAALNHFDPDKGVAFHTYAAAYIRKYISEFIGKLGNMVYEPRNSKERGKKLQGEYDYMREQDNELYLQMTETPNVAVLSLEDTLSADADAGCRADVSGNTDESFDSDSQLFREEKNRETRRLIHALLTPQEEKIISLRFGLNEEEKQVWEIAVMEGVGETRIRQILHSAALKLQASKEARDLLAA